jgi:hypothetical protein
MQPVEVASRTIEIAARFLAATADARLHGDTQTRTSDTAVDPVPAPVRHKRIAERTA